MKNMPDTFSIDFACLQISRFETVILYSFWDIPQIKTVKPPDKSQAFPTGTLSYVGVALNFNSFGRNGITTFPWPSCFKSMLTYGFIRKMPKFLRVFAQDVPYGMMKAYVL